MRKRRSPNDANLWTSRDAALLQTFEILSRLRTGRRHELLPISVPFSSAQSPIDETLVASSPFQLFSWEAPGDGTYSHRSGFVVGMGVGGLAAMGTFAIGQAVANSKRKSQAWQDAQPRWLPIDDGMVSVGTYGFYFHTGTAILYWDWPSIQYAALLGPASLEIIGESQNGNIRWLIESHLSELIFCLWAGAVHPQHPGLLNGAWIPPGWVEKAQMYMGNDSGISSMVPQLAPGETR